MSHRLIAVAQRAWFPSAWLFAIAGLAWAQSPTPTPEVRPAPVFKSIPAASQEQPQTPSEVPTPPAIPAIPILKEPLTVKPNSAFGGYTIHGDGTTDDTAGVQAALNASDIIVAPATYAIAGSVSIPTGRNISCQKGAIFLDTQSKGTRMFHIGFSRSSVGNNSVVGCHFQGTDYLIGDPGSYANYGGGNSGYSELFEILSGSGVHTDNVIIEDNVFSNAQGDALLTYSPCGARNTGAPCNNGPPGSEGPSNVFIVNNTFFHCAQPGVHLNGGQNLVVKGNTLTDCTGDDEADSNVLQVMTSWWFNNKFTTQYGTLNSLNGKIVGSEHSCTGNDLIPEDDSGCWSFNNQIDGVGPGGASILREPSGCAGGGGHYVKESLTNGAQLRTNC